MSTEPTSPLGLLLSDDLIFTSRIVGIANELGLTVHAARSPEALLELAARQLPRCVLLDLSNSGLRVAEFLRQLRASCDPMPYLVAYGPHVHAELLRAAREAGCDLVLPRSKFVEDLPRALPDWFAFQRNTLRPLSDS